MHVHQGLSPHKMPHDAGKFMNIIFLYSTTRIILCKRISYVVSDLRFGGGPFWRLRPALVYSANDDEEEEEARLFLRTECHKITISF